METNPQKLREMRLQQPKQTLKTACRQMRIHQKMNGKLVSNANRNRSLSGPLAPAA